MKTKNSPKILKIVEEFMEKYKPTKPYGGEFKYYYLAIPVGVIGIAGLVIFLINILIKPGTI